MVTNKTSHQFWTRTYIYILYYLYDFSLTTTTPWLQLRPHTSFWSQRDLPNEPSDLSSMIIQETEPSCPRERYDRSTEDVNYLSVINSSTYL